jgi:hypothetical protein
MFLEIVSALADGKTSGCRKRSHPWSSEDISRPIFIPNDTRRLVPELLVQALLPQVSRFHDV